jgi:hypothetical protein
MQDNVLSGRTILYDLKEVIPQIGGIQSQAGYNRKWNPQAGRNLLLSVAIIGDFGTPGITLFQVYRVE